MSSSSANTWLLPAGLLIAIGLALLLLASWAFPVLRLPAPGGPLAVARVELHLTHGSSEREVMVSLWYPTQATDGARAPYLDKTGRVAPALSELLRHALPLGLRLPPALFARIGTAETAAFADAPLFRPNDEPLPLLLFSPGLHDRAFGA